MRELYRGGHQVALEIEGHNLRAIHPLGKVSILQKLSSTSKKTKKKLDSFRGTNLFSITSALTRTLTKAPMAPDAVVTWFPTFVSDFLVFATLSQSLGGQKPGGILYY